MKFRLDKVIGDLLVDTVKEAGRKLSSSAGRVSHRSKRSGPVGGKITAALRNGERLVERKRWGGKIKWNDLGQAFLFLVRGTKRQKARPVDLVPKAEDVRARVEAAAADHFSRRDRRRGKR